MYLRGNSASRVRRTPVVLRFVCLVNTATRCITHGYLASPSSYSDTASLHSHEARTRCVTRSRTMSDSRPNGPAAVTQSDTSATDGHSVTPNILDEGLAFPLLFGSTGLEYRRGKFVTFSEVLVTVFNLYSQIVGNRPQGETSGVRII
jgi:hypothetical protein